MPRHASHYSGGAAVLLSAILWALFPLAAHAAPPSTLRLRVTLTGAAAGDNFGRVSGAGDVNGDGYADWIVGAPFNDAVGTNCGRAYVYFGGPGADATPEVTLTGAPGDGLGWSVSDAGDVNGDGYADVIVGATGAGGTGRAHVYFGGPSMDTVADLTLAGEGSGDSFGYSVSGAGDVNRDGFADVIVGALWNDAAGTDAGRAYLYYGGIAPNAVADVILTGEAAGDDMGVSVSGAGDVNGDSYADFIVGALFNDAAGANAGRAYLYFGGSPVNNTADLLLSGELAGDRFGESVSDAGDMNGDGFADVIVGATYHLTSASSEGRAYVYYGGISPDGAADIVFSATGSDDLFGFSTSNAGDVNGDGYSDVIVGAYFSDAGGFDAGRAYIFHGGPSADNVPDHAVNGAAASDAFGHSVAGVGDVWGDGFDDVIVGAPYNDVGGLDAGRAYLYDMNRFVLLAPNGGETWNVGAMKEVTWRGPERVNIWLSVDGGRTYEIQKSGVGGSELNVYSLRVPHAPTRFALIKLTSADASLGGEDTSDSLFTIQTSVSLLSMMAAPRPEGGASVTWQTNPGPDDLAGYRVDSSTLGSPEWRTLVSLTRESSVVDPSGGPGTRYRLFAVNGFGDELWLGEAAIRPTRALSAWPLPYRSGKLHVAFAAAGGLGGGGASTQVGIFDVHGKLVRRLAEGTFTQGFYGAAWDGRDARGRSVAAGIYFLRSVSGGQVGSLRLCVLR